MTDSAAPGRCIGRKRARPASSVSTFLAPFMGFGADKWEQQPAAGKASFLGTDPILFMYNGAECTAPCHR
jgi:hypothetical protein